MSWIEHDSFDDGLLRPCVSCSALSSSHKLSTPALPCVIHIITRVTYQKETMCEPRFVTRVMLLWVATSCCNDLPVCFDDRRTENRKLYPNFKTNPKTYQQLSCLLYAHMSSICCLFSAVNSRTPLLCRAPVPDRCMLRRDHSGPCLRTGAHYGERPKDKENGAVF